jgi:hypothetical protein
VAPRAIQDRGEARVAESPSGELREPALNEVQPRRTGRREVEMPSGAFGGSPRLSGECDVAGVSTVRVRGPAIVVVVLRLRRGGDP